MYFMIFTNHVFWSMSLRNQFANSSIACFIHYPEALVYIYTFAYLYIFLPKCILKKHILNLQSYKVLFQPFKQTPYRKISSSNLEII